MFQHKKNIHSLLFQQKKNTQNVNKILKTC